MRSGLVLLLANLFALSSSTAFVPTSSLPILSSMPPQLRQRRAKADKLNSADDEPSLSVRGGSALSAHGLEPLLSSAKHFGSVCGAGFALSVATGTHLHLDLFGTGVFLPASVAALKKHLALNQGMPISLSLMSSCMVICAWSFRLALFLFYRATVLKVRGDGERRWRCGVLLALPLSTLL